MRPTDGEGPFDDPRYFFEPWWPGIRALVLVEAGRVRLRAEALTDPLPAFPELAGVAGLLRGDGVVLDATLMVLDARGRPSRTLLERRLAGGTGGSAALVSADLLYLDGANLAKRPFGERRGRACGAAGAVALVPRWPGLRRRRDHRRGRSRRARVPGSLGAASRRALRIGGAGDAWYRVPVVAAPRELPPLLAVFRRLPL